MDTSYKIAELGINADGSYTVIWLGNHTDQGGLTFRYGHAKLQDLESAIDLLAACTAKHEQDYKRLIGEKDKK